MKHTEFIEIFFKYSLQCKQDSLIITKQYVNEFGSVYIRHIKSFVQNANEEVHFLKNIDKFLCISM